MDYRTVEEVLPGEEWMTYDDEEMEEDNEEEYGRYSGIYGEELGSGEKKKEFQTFGLLVFCQKLRL